MEGLKPLSRWLRVLLQMVLIFLCTGLTVHAAEPPSLSRETVNLFPSQVYRLTLTDTFRKAQFTVQDPTVARVDEQGVVTALSVGSTDVFCSLSDGTNLICLISVLEGSSPEQVALSESSIALYTKEKHTLQAAVLPEGAVSPFLWWYSSDESVATVDQSGNVEALRPGVAVITAESASSAVSACCIVRVFSEGGDTVFGSGLSGLLLNASGETLPHTLLEWRGALSGMKTTTDDKGRFSFQNVMMGSGLLLIYEEGAEGDPVSAGVVVRHSEEKLTCIVSDSGVSVLYGSAASQGQSPRDIILGREVEKMEVGEQTELNYTVLPATLSTAELLFASSNEKVLQVSEKGSLTAVGPGTAQVIVSSPDGRVTRQCTVVVRDNGPDVFERLLMLFQLLIMLLLLVLIFLLVRYPVRWKLFSLRQPAPPEQKEE